MLNSATLPGTLQTEQWEGDVQQHCILGLVLWFHCYYTIFSFPTETHIMISVTNTQIPGALVKYYSTNILGLFKASPFKIFISTINQITMCNINWYVNSVEPSTEHYHLTAVFVSSVECFSVFQLIVLVFWPVNITNVSLVSTPTIQFFPAMKI